MSVDRPLQQTIDNADQIREIEGRVQSLKEVLESPVGNRDGEEKARRDALRKSVVSPSTEIFKILNRSGYSQEVNYYNCEARTTFRETRDREVPEKR